MTDKFLGTTSNEKLDFSNGSVDIFGATVGAYNLGNNLPVKTNYNGVLTTNPLVASDITGLQSTLDTKLTNPIELSEVDTPANPGANSFKIFVSNADQKLHMLDSTGTDTAFENDGDYLTIDGKVAMSGNLDMGGQNITNVSNVDSVDIGSLKTQSDGKLNSNGATLTSTLELTNGQALDTSSVLEIKNIAGTSTFFIDGNGRSYAPAGTAALPSVSFQSSSGCGLRSSGVNNLEISSGGSDAIIIDNLNVKLNNRGLQMNDNIIYGSTQSGLDLQLDSNSVDASLGEIIMGSTVSMAENLQMNSNTIYGSTSSGGDLTLESTSHATSGDIICNDALKVDVIDEKTGSAGVTIEGVLIKDGGLTATGFSGVDFGSGRTIEMSTPGSYPGFVFSTDQTDNYNRFNIANKSDAVSTERNMTFDFNTSKAGIKIFDGPQGVQPSADGLYDLGGDDKQWKDIYCSGVMRTGTYTVATVPLASSYTGGMIYVSDGAAGGATLAFSNGTGWIRSDNRAAISAT